MSIIHGHLFCRGLKYVLIREGASRYLAKRYISTNIRYFPEARFVGFTRFLSRDSTAKIIQTEWVEDMMASPRSISFCRLFVFIALHDAICYSYYLSEGAAKSANRDLTLAGGRVGEIKLGMSSNDIDAALDKKLTRLVDLQLEGMYSSAIELFKTEAEMDNPEIIFELDHDKVYRIQVHSPRGS